MAPPVDENAIPADFVDAIEELHQLRVTREIALRTASEAVRDSTRLTRLLTILNDSGPVAALLDKALATLSELFLADIAVLLDPVGTGTYVPLAAIGLPETLQHMPFCSHGDSCIQRIMRTGAPVIVDAGTAECQQASQLIDMGASTAVGLPVGGNEPPRGVLILARLNPQPFSEAEVGLLKTMAYRIGRTLIDAQHNIQLEQLVKSGRELSRRLNLPDVTRDAVNILPEIARADSAAILLRKTTGTLYCAAYAAMAENEAAALCTVAESLIFLTRLSHGDPFSTDDLHDTLRESTIPPPSELTARSLLAIPIYRDDTLHGILFGARHAPIAFNAGAMQAAVLLGDQVTAAIENAGLYQAVHNELAERKRLEEEKRKWERHQQQIQKAESMSSMAGAIAHHFNNQLCIVLGNLEILMMELADNPTTAIPLADAKEASEKASELSLSMLTYIGQSIGVRKSLDVAQVCRQSLPLLKTATSALLSVRVSLPRGGPNILGNSNQIQQLLTNLVTNASEAMVADTGSIEIAVSEVDAANIPLKNRFPLDWLPERQPYICISVTDNGCGIAEQDFDRLFDPFYSRKCMGRGLGLPVALGIVKVHRGVITVSSQEGEGSTFRVFLPQLTLEKSQPMPPQTTAPTGDGRGVLLVDDEKAIREFTRRLLIDCGFNVLEASNGVEAVDVYEAHRSEIHVVLCDLSMPRMNGWETMAALHRLSPELPVVLVSGHDETKIGAAATKAPPSITAMSSFLHKPFRNAELWHALNCALSPNTSS